MTRQPENDPWWTMEDIATYLGMPLKTVQCYRYRSQHGHPTALPSEDEMFGRTPVWRKSRVLHWHDHERPGRGKGGGRPRKSGTTNLRARHFAHHPRGATQRV